MRISRAVYPAAIVVLLCIFATLAAVVRTADARPTGPTAGASKVAGTVSTRVVINRFRAVGKRVIGQGTVISTYKDAAGATSVKRKPFRLTIRERHSRQRQSWSGVQQEEPLCHILFLEVGEVDLTLAGLHATLRAFNRTSRSRSAFRLGDQAAFSDDCSAIPPRAVARCRRRAKPSSLHGR